MTTRDKISQDAKSLAEALSPDLPGTVEELWQVIEDRLDQVRADSYNEGFNDGRGY